jgi:hypothetical protein
MHQTLNWQHVGAASETVILLPRQYGHGGLPGSANSGGDNKQPRRIAPPVIEEATHNERENKLLGNANSKLSVFLTSSPN